jgi:hypothetical protein
MTHRLIEKLRELRTKTRHETRETRQAEYQKRNARWWPAHALIITECTYQEYTNDPTYSKAKDLWLQPTTPCSPSVTVIDSPAMDKERFQQMEKRLNEQAEATWAMNKTLNKFIAIMGNQEAARSVTSPPPVSPPHVTTTLQASQPSRVKLGIPSNLIEIEHKDAPSSCPVSCTFCSLNRTSSMCTSCKGNLTNLRRELHLSLAEGNPK